LLDRDGVINVDVGYLIGPEEWRFQPGMLAYLRRSPLPRAVITNQSGVARGYGSPEDFRHLMEWVQAQTGPFDAVCVCFDPADQRPSRRKPAPDMVLEALARLDVAPEEALMIGDRESDLEAAAAAGVPGAWFGGAPQLPALPE
jgi:D-glycero-D-manno-heptose 1,7-bisphosphate phosphatase